MCGSVIYKAGGKASYGAQLMAGKGFETAEQQNTQKRRDKEVRKTKEE